MTQRTVLMLCAVAALAMACGAAEAEKITLANGDVLTAKVVSQDDQNVVVEHASLGAMTIPRAQVAAIATEDAVATAAPADQPPASKPTISTGAGALHTDAAKAATDGEPPPDQLRPSGLFGTTFLAGWNRRFELGVNGTEGNSQQMSIRALFTMDYEDPFDRWKTTALYFRDEADGETGSNEFTAEVTKDWLIPNEKHFFFGNGKYEYDQFEAWESRVSGFGGIGYQFHKDEKWDLLGRAGAGGNYAFDAQNDFTPEAMLGLEANWRLKKGHVLSAYTTFFPALDPPGSEFRNITGVAYVLEIDKKAGLSLKLGAENEYESDVEPGEKHNDLKYFLSLVWGF